jgi:hypothetical protein
MYSHHLLSGFEEIPAVYLLFYLLLEIRFSGPLLLTPVLTVREKMPELNEPPRVNKLGLFPLRYLNISYLL